MISEQEFKDWLQHPVTQEFRKVLAAKRADLRNEWEQSNPAEYAEQTFVLASVGNVGWCRGLAFAETLDYEGYMSEVDPDGEARKRNEPERT
jgi:hypothetical protein